jgi:hypothetical protein
MTLPTSIDGSAAAQAALADAWGLADYRIVMDGIHRCDVSRDSDYQRAFNGFYRVRRDAAWREAFYSTMEREKDNPTPAFETVVTELYERTGNVEASYTSKMLATIDPVMPILDGHVLKRLGLTISGTTGQARLASAIETYEMLRTWYDGYLETEDAERNIALFDSLLPEYPWISSVKKIDCLLWSSV